MAGSSQAPKTAASVVSERPDPISAMLTAQTQGTRVEDDSARTENTSTFANPDGTWTTETTAAPTRFKGADGAWHQVDLSLQTGADGSVAPKGHPFGLRLAGPGGAPGQDRDLASFGDGQHALTLRWRGHLPKPEIDPQDQAQVRYPDVDPGVDMTVRALRTGFEQSLVIKTRPRDPSSFTETLPLVAHGLTINQTEAGLAFSDQAGKVLAVMPAPSMWDAQVNSNSLDHTHLGQVTAKLVRHGATADLVLTPNPAFLADPATKYPVTIDPSTTWTTNGDVFVEQGYGTSEWSATELKLGNNGSGQVARSFISFPTSAQAGKHVLSATLNLFNFHSWSCSARNWQVWDTHLATTSTIWTNQPSWNKLWATSSATRSDNGTCGTGWVSADITSLAQAWVNNGNTSNWLGIRAQDETDAYAWKRFYSSEYGSVDPYVSVTYNTPPGTPTSPSPASGAVTADTTPGLSAYVSDPDKTAVQGKFYIKDLTTGTWVTPSTGSYGLTVTAQGTSTFTSPTLTDGHHYQWEVYASDTVPELSAAPAGWFDLYVDTSAPSSESISCPHPSGTWVSASTDSESCTFLASDAHLSQFGWYVDGTWKGYLSQSAGAATVPIQSFGPGLHRIDMYALDSAGNSGALVEWTVGVGTNGIDAPAQDARSSSRFPVHAAAQSGPTGAYVRWVADGASNWARATGAAVKLASTGATWDGSLVSAGGGVATPDLVWDADLSGVPAPAVVAVVDVAVCFTASGVADSCTAPRRVSRLAHAFGGAFAAAPAGPGQVSLGTGELSLSGTDASLSGYYDSLSVIRGYTSQAGPSAGAGVLGPHWTLSAPSNSSDAADLTVVDSTGTDRSLAFQAADGSVALYTEPAGASGLDPVGTYIPMGDTQTDGDTVTIKKPTSSAYPLTLTLTSTDGVATSWTKASSSAPWLLAGSAVSVPTGTTAAPGSPSPTTWVYDSANRVSRATATVPGVDCTTAPLTTRGCRSLTFTYSGTTTATSTTFGGYTGQLSEIDEVAWNPAADANAGAMSTQAVACYGYDTTGMLRLTWDPRPGQPAGADVHCDPAHPVLATRYDYDSPTSGHITAITPPGAAGWSFAYDGTGRLSSVTRQDTDRAGGAGADTTTFVYAVPLSGTNLPDLTNTAAWGQTTDAPVTGVAVFAPDRQPALTGGTPASGDWPYAAITYLDTTGRDTNTAGYGANTWTIDSQQYDAQDNLTWSLPADGWAAAAANPSTQQSVARARASYNFYSDDGTELLDSYGPAHDITLADGTIVAGARTHTHDEYDNTQPAGGGPYRLKTATYTWVSTTADPTGLTPAQRAAETRTEVRTTTYDYTPVQSTDGDGKRLGIPVKTTTTVAGTSTITRTVRTDPDGHPIAVSQPKDTAGTSAGTTLTTYYAHGAAGVCGQHDEWIGLPCTSGPAAQPASGPPLPTTTVTGYSMLLAPTSTTETAPGGDVLRTTSTGFDAAGRPTSSSVTSNVTGDSPVADTTTTYDPATGQVASVATANGTISTSYDSLGRVKSYTDADGQVTTTSYDADSRPVTVTTPVGTTTYTYDSNSAGQVEHRGLLTAVDPHLARADGSTVPSLTTAQYDAAGRPSRIDYPGGISATRTYDPAGQTTDLDYTLSGAGLTVGGITNPDGTHPLLDFTASYNGFGQIADNSSPQSDQTYSYDGLGRLTQVSDTVDGVSNGAGGYTTQCTVRAYSLDGDSNRTALNSYAGAAGGACPTVDSTTTATLT
ncbi:MAG: DNRLRE domain-containing protein, partial [Motilibacteraceae bacterium]